MNRYLLRNLAKGREYNQREGIHSKERGYTPKRGDTVQGEGIQSKERGYSPRRGDTVQGEGIFDVVVVWSASPKFELLFVRNTFHPPHRISSF